MEILFKQLREKFANSDQVDREDRRTRLRSSSFKQERKKAWNWFLRQFSNPMSTNDGEHVSSDGEFKTVIAAATFAIVNMTEAEAAKEEGPLETFRRGLRSKKEGNKGALPEPGSLSGRFTGKGAETLIRTKSKKEDNAAAPPDPGQLSRRFTGIGEQKSSATAATEPNLPEKTTGKVPSAKKTLSFALDDRNTTKTVSSKDKMGKGESTSTKAESLREKMGRADFSSPSRPKVETAIDGKREDYPYESRTDTKADTWEKAQLAKIKKRFEKQISRIQAWEEEKTKKARHQHDKNESRFELKRLRIAQEYRNEIERINKIAKQARDVAEERKRNEELKTIETAREIRSTGKVPFTCFGLG